VPSADRFWWWWHPNVFVGAWMHDTWCCMSSTKSGQ
jgi:hypothetical protein